MLRLLLVSTSTTHGTEYLEHCASQIVDLFHGADIAHVLFIPYALHDRDRYTKRARSAFLAMGVGLESIHQASDPVAAVHEAKGIFVGGGNTFRLLKTLQELELIDVIRERVLSGMPYVGTSAGSNVACPTIKTTNDMPIVFPRSLDALDLIPIQLNAHYLDPDPDSTHMGETRETRIKEFHEENDTPVLGLREGAMLSVEGQRLELLGDTGGKLFRKDRQPEVCEPGTRLDEVLV